MQSPVWALVTAIGWLAVIPAVAAVLVCVMHLQRSRWVSVLLAGFGANAVLAILSRVAMPILTGALSLSPNTMAVAYGALSLFNVLADAIVVWGLWGLLSSDAPRTETTPR
jgi:hypothetical protein